MTKMRLAVFAYHDIGYECLKYLIEQGEEIVAVVTHQDDPNEEIWFRSVAGLAGDHHLPVYMPANPNEPGFVDRIRDLSPDLILSFYYRRLLSKELLSIPRLGGINLHGSLLPKYRGRSPVNWALIHGETETGVTLHYMIEKADAGDIIAQKRVPIDIRDTALTLFRKLTTAATELLRDSYPLIKAGRAPRIPQDARQATVFGGRRPEDGKIDWAATSRDIYNLIRAVTHPYPGAFTFYGRRKLYVWGSMLNRQSSTVNSQSLDREQPGTVLAIERGSGISVKTGDGSLLLTRAQIEGDDETRADQLGIPAGSRLGQ